MSSVCELLLEKPVKDDIIYIGGIEELSLVDVLEHTSFTVWFSFCNFRCPWCSNGTLARGLTKRKVSVDYIVSKVMEAKDFVDYFHVTGGEPTLQFKGLGKLLCRVKKYTNLPLSIDTNGTFPEVIERLLAIMNHVAMDIKAPLNDIKKYSMSTGMPIKVVQHYIPRIIKTMKLIIRDVDFVEFRTTMVPKIIGPEEVKKIALFLNHLLKYLKPRGRVVFVVQQFIPYEGILDEHFRKEPRTDPNIVLETAKIVSEILDNVEVYYRTLEEGSIKMSKL